ncbi:unnamed protein product, partial [Ascophyllum nodosum]
SKEAGCGKHLGRQHHQLLGQSYRQAGQEDSRRHGRGNLPHPVPVTATTAKG